MTNSNAAAAFERLRKIEQDRLDAARDDLLRSLLPALAYVQRQVQDDAEAAEIVDAANVAWDRWATAGMSANEFLAEFGDQGR